jgi:hypothetical protein
MSMTSINPDGFIIIPTRYNTGNGITATASVAVRAKVLFEDLGSYGASDAILSKCV